MSNGFSDVALDARTFLPSFNSLFDVNYMIGNSNLVGKKSMANFCSLGEIYDRFYNKCRDLICGFENEFFEGECRPSIIEIKPITSDLDVSDKNRTELESVTVENFLDNRPDPVDNSESNPTENGLVEWPTYREDPYTAEFQKCVKISLTTGFMELKNDSIYLQQYNLVVDKGSYNLTNSKLLICVPFSALFDKFENHYSSIAYICLIFSIICLTFYLIIFCLVPDLRNLSGRNLASLCLSLIMVYFSFCDYTIRINSK